MRSSVNSIKRKQRPAKADRAQDKQRVCLRTAPVAACGGSVRFLSPSGVMSFQGMPVLTKTPEGSLAPNNKARRASGELCGESRLPIPRLVASHLRENLTNDPLELAATALSSGERSGLPIAWTSK